MITVKADRNSVSMGDDMDDHRRTYEVDPAMKIPELMELLIKDVFFPFVEGNDSVWRLTLEDVPDYFATYFTKSGRIFYYHNQKNSILSQYLNEDDKVLRIKLLYGSSYGHARGIFWRNNCNHANIERRGLIEEYRHCNVTAKEEEKWLRDPLREHAYVLPDDE